MNKQQFLDALNKELCGLPIEDKTKSIEYYNEMIDDLLEDDLSEEDAVMQIGTPKEIAQQILMDIPLPKLVKAKAKPNRNLGALEIVLLIIGSPVWLSLLIAVTAIIFSIYVALWSVIISLYAIAFSLVACGVAGIFAFVLFALIGKIPQAVFIIGSGFLCIGFAILMFIATNLVVKGFWWANKKIWLGIKNCFIKRGDENENY